MMMVVVVGARADVCQGKQCSLFYAKRFCMTCAAAHKPHFPPEIQKVAFGRAHLLVDFLVLLNNRICVWCRQILE